MEALDTLFADHTHYHSTLQCRSFITAKAGVTPFGQYRQALRELTSRTWSAFEELLRMEELRVDVEELSTKIERLGDCPPKASELHLRRLLIERARAEVQLAQLEQSTTDRLREWAEFYAQACALRRQLGLIEGETLTRERREALEIDMFGGQFAQTIRSRIACGQPGIDPSLFLSIETLPEPLARLLIEGAQSKEGFERMIARFPEPAPPAPGDVPAIADARHMVRARFDALPLAYSSLPEIVAG